MARFRRHRPPAPERPPQQVGDNRMRGGSVVREARAAATAARGTEEGGGGPGRARPAGSIARLAAAADARPSTHMVPGGAHLFKRQEEGDTGGGGQVRHRRAGSGQMVPTAAAAARGLEAKDFARARSLLTRHSGRRHQPQSDGGA